VTGKQGLRHSTGGAQMPRLPMHCSRAALAVFELFRGRPPKTDALLRHTGLAA